MCHGRDVEGSFERHKSGESVMEAVDTQYQIQHHDRSRSESTSI